MRRRGAPRLLMNTPATTRRRWLRYSLRTLFVLVTLLCVWLGLWANRAERQKRAVAWFKAHGGEVHYDYEFTMHPAKTDEYTKVDGAQLIFEYDENGDRIAPPLPGPSCLHD